MQENATHQRRRTCAGCHKTMPARGLTIVSEQAQATINTEVCGWTCALELAVRAVATELRAHPPATVAAAIRRTVDNVLEKQLGDRLHREEMPASDRKVVGALELMQLEKPGPIETTILGLALRADMSPPTVYTSLRRLDHRGVIRYSPRRGGGSTVELLRAV